MSEKHLPKILLRANMPVSVCVNIRTRAVPKHSLEPKERTWSQTPLALCPVTSSLCQFQWDFHFEYMWPFFPSKCLNCKSTHPPPSQSSYNISLIDPCYKKSCWQNYTELKFSKDKVSMQLLRGALWLALIDIIMRAVIVLTKQTTFQSGRRTWPDVGVEEETGVDWRELTSPGLIVKQWNMKTEGVREDWSIVFCRLLGCNYKVMKRSCLRWW